MNSLDYQVTLTPIENSSKIVAEFIYPRQKKYVCLWDVNTGLELLDKKLSDPTYPVVIDNGTKIVTISSQSKGFIICDLSGTQKFDYDLSGKQKNYDKYIVLQIIINIVLV